MKSISAELLMEIEAMAASSPEQRLFAIERGMGFEIVRPGDMPWLSTSRWHPATIVSIKGRRVRLVALMAAKPGSGALLQLISDLTAAGLEPVIVEPSDQLAATLVRWGWKRRQIGKGFKSQEIWYPRRGTNP